ncbi:preprotein translocase subunit SecG [candidate division WWE3 bacterium RIFOXYC1_FULL_39_7]|uniref:Protein-export membrane protein SecG n=2 Tax=Katanobacteria TaxID=422282 RepID=A0A1F4X724_UNCKA|nr:MAG: preprotein translocase subunit SecG [candidate division WWE3 bacterium RIFOXYC1_FULL_39_7]OGC77505.1 MAG: preprotein translocase subunit SecG [candidate division WWE3 bacterium RIFOXYD1_FULL_39_9]
MDLLLISKTTQIILTLAIVVLILIQSKGKGLAAGVGSAFTAYRSRRGVEKLVFILTIVFSALLITNSLLIVILS